jgi:plasmid stability protein
MATLTIRNVPDELYVLLKAKAAANRRSLNQEAIAQLQLAAAKPRTADEMLAIMRAARAIAPGLWVTPEQIEASINEGRR